MAAIYDAFVGMVLQTTFEDQDGTALNLGSATVKTCRLTDPTGASRDLTATEVTDGTDGKFKYTTTDGDIDMSGRWQAQFYVEAGAYKVWSEINGFDVEANLPAP
jgi:hypothetical protein